MDPLHSGLQRHGWRLHLHCDRRGRQGAHRLPRLRCDQPKAGCLGRLIVDADHAGCWIGGPGHANHRGRRWNEPDRLLRRGRRRPEVLAGRPRLTRGHGQLDPPQNRHPDGRRGHRGCIARHWADPRLRRGRNHSSLLGRGQRGPAWQRRGLGDLHRPRERERRGWMDPPRGLRVPQLRFQRRLLVRALLERLYGGPQGDVLGLRG